MSVKTAGVGKFAIPTAPAAGASITAGAANVFTTTYVALIASTAAALYITGIYVNRALAGTSSYYIVQLATGGVGSETVVSQIFVPLPVGTTVLAYVPIFPPIPVATATRIAAKTADTAGGSVLLVSLECIAQSNVVDDGITVGTVNLVNTLTTYTGNTPQTGDAFLRLGVAGVGLTNLGDARIANLDATVSSRTKPADTQAAVTLVTTLTTYTGNTPQTGDAFARLGVAGVGLTNIGDARMAGLDATISSRLAGASYTAPDNAGITTIKTQTNKLTFTVANKLDVNVLNVNGILVQGNGQAATPWGP